MVTIRRSRITIIKIKLEKKETCVGVCKKHIEVVHSDYVIYIKVMEEVGYLVKHVQFGKHVLQRGVESHHSMNLLLRNKNSVNKSL